jgi:hypothetical protein
MSSSAHYRPTLSFLARQGSRVSDETLDVGGWSLHVGGWRIIPTTGTELNGKLLLSGIMAIDYPRNEERGYHSGLKGRAGITRTFTERKRST